MEENFRYHSIAVQIPSYLKDDYIEAIKYLGVHRRVDLTKHCIYMIGQANKLKRLEKQGKDKEYIEQLLKLTKNRCNDEEE